jgi:hypothetical protein
LLLLLRFLIIPIRREKRVMRRDEEEVIIVVCNFMRSKIRLQLPSFRAIAFPSIDLHKLGATDSNSSLLHI